MSLSEIKCVDYKVKSFEQIYVFSSWMSNTSRLRNIGVVHSEINTNKVKMRTLIGQGGSTHAHSYQ